VVILALSEKITLGDSRKLSLKNTLLEIALATNLLLLYRKYAALLLLKISNFGDFMVDAYCSCFPVYFLANKIMFHRKEELV
jgi:hypothetical protein